MVNMREVTEAMPSITAMLLSSSYFLGCVGIGCSVLPRIYGASAAAMVDGAVDGWEVGGGGW